MIVNRLCIGFRNFETKTLYQPDDTLQEQPIYYGTVESLPMGVNEDVVLTFPKGYYQDIEASISVPAYFEAPVKKGILSTQDTDLLLMHLPMDRLWLLVFHQAHLQVQLPN